MQALERGRVHYYQLLLLPQTSRHFQILFDLHFTHVIQTRLLDDGFLIWRYQRGPGQPSKLITNNGQRAANLSPVDEPGQAAEQTEFNGFMTVCLVSVGPLGLLSRHTTEG